MSRSKVTFFTLPREIRDRIYILATPPQVLCICPSTALTIDRIASQLYEKLEARVNAKRNRMTRQQVHGRFRYSHIDLARNPLPAINKQIRDEFCDHLPSNIIRRSMILLRRKTIEVCSVACLHRFLLSCSPRDVKNLRTATVRTVSETSANRNSITKYQDCLIRHPRLTDVRALQSVLKYLIHDLTLPIKDMTSESQYVLSLGLGSGRVKHFIKTEINFWKDVDGVKRDPKNQLAWEAIHQGWEKELQDHNDPMLNSEALKYRHMCSYSRLRGSLASITGRWGPALFRR